MDGRSRYWAGTSAGGKLAAFLLLAAAAVYAPRLTALAPVAAAVILAAAMTRRGFARLGVSCLGVASLVAVAAAFKWASAAGNGGAFAAAEATLLLAGKMLTLAALSGALAAATPGDELARALVGPARLLAWAKVDAAPAALTLAFALRYLPALASSFRGAADTARLRAGGRLGWGARLRLAPLVLRAGYAHAAGLPGATALALALRGCRTPAAWLAAASVRRNVGWPTVITAAFAAGAAVGLGVLCPRAL
jgi:hypothetical protein